MNSKLLSSYPYSIRLFEDKNCLIDSFVDYLEAYLLKRISSVKAKPIGMATGRTMQPIYSVLVDRILSWETHQIKVFRNGWLSFNLDEYIGLRRNDKNSYYSYMIKHLASPLNLNYNNIRIPNSEAVDLEFEALKYSEDLISCGGIGLQLLGLGENGHIGFNEPPCGPKSICRVVELSETTIHQNKSLFIHESDVPRKAITLGLKDILGADEISLVVMGKEKANILKEMLNNPCCNKLPSSWLSLHRKVTLWVDRDAFSQASL